MNPDTPKLCGAKNKQGNGTCSKTAGWGTNHPGTGHCRLHAGNTPGGNASAAKEEMQIMGIAIEMDPFDALLSCVSIAAGEVAYCTRRIEQLRPDEVVITHWEEQSYQNDDGEGVTNTKVSNAAELNLWIRTRQRSVDSLARYSKMAIDAGVDERRVALAEKWGDQIASLLKGVLDDLELTQRQKKEAPEIVRRHMAILETSGRELVPA
jgi:hypothetical protein